MQSNNVLFSQIIKNVMPLKEKNVNMYKTKAQNSANFNKKC